MKYEEAKYNGIKSNFLRCLIQILIHPTSQMICLPKSHDTDNTCATNTKYYIRF